MGKKKWCSKPLQKSFRKVYSTYTVFSFLSVWEVEFFNWVISVLCTVYSKVIQRKKERNRNDKEQLTVKKQRRGNRSGKQWEGERWGEKSIWKFWLLTKWWISVQIVFLRAVSFPGNATRYRHGYQDDKSFPPLGLKQEHFVSQDSLNFLSLYSCWCFHLLCSKDLHFTKQSCSWKIFSFVVSLIESYYWASCLVLPWTINSACWVILKYSILSFQNCFKIVSLGNLWL